MISPLKHKNPNCGIALVIVGVNRGGTSLISSCLNSIGIHLGDKCHPPTYEDLELSSYLENKKWKLFKEKVKFYEATHNLFAWKSPNSVLHLNKINKIFSNPKYIFIFRDIYAISLLQKEVQNREILTSFQKSLRKYQNILNFTKDLKNQYLMISYEKALLNPYEYAKCLIEFTGKEPKKDLINEVVKVVQPSPKNYKEWMQKSINVKKFEEFRYKGIAHFSQKSLKGWVINLEHNKPVQIQIYLNDQFLEEINCNLYRNDLIKKGISKNGENGFYYEFKKPLKIGDKVSVITKNEKIHLMNSPYTFLSKKIN